MQLIVHRFVQMTKQDRGDSLARLGCNEYDKRPMGILLAVDIALARCEPIYFPLTAFRCHRLGYQLKRDGETLVLFKGSRQIRFARTHLLYSLDLAQYFDVYFSQVLPNIEKGVAEVDYSGPRLHTLANGLQFELASLPEEFSAIDAYLRWTKPMAGETVFDVGAYCGVFTYVLSRLVGPAGRVIAFEPDPINREILLRNVCRHGLQNVTVEVAALSNNEGWRIFNSQGCLGSGFAACADRSARGSSITVRAMTLDAACQHYGVPSFVKIDAEGAEIEILSGARDLLSSHRASFVLDTNHFRDGVLTAGRVETMFRESGYETESLASPFMTTWARSSRQHTP